MIKIKQNPEYDKIITEFKTFARKLEQLIEKYELYDSSGHEIIIEFDVDKHSKTLYIDQFWIGLTTENREVLEQDKNEIINYLNEITPMDATFVFYHEYEPLEEDTIFEHKVVPNKESELQDFFEENNIKEDFTLVYLPSVNKVFLKNCEIRYGSPEYYSIKEVINHFNNLLN